MSVQQEPWRKLAINEFSVAVLKNMVYVVQEGKLKNKTIDRLQNYYGIVVHENIGNLDSMKIAIHASLFHVASFKKNSWHNYCPPGENSWCRHQSDKVTGLSTYKPGPGFAVRCYQAC